ncbi:phenylalanine--tRNA ligase subunit alpha [Paenibacillus graminis]|uniref:Phenylalanine--tRNA ligase alpha subunit n=1 Tax=Paenibacillus graminis TaxID=189425 RepID=A0A089NGM4_9BACL|nr:phenylalanine--tRNA ligase subunit alpha [Paenibacillus graminis]AIQ68164.1 phenylalanine--tRNA ligase [Paenibacillus graminis]
MKTKLDELSLEAKKAILQAESLAELNELRVKYFGKKGLITEISKKMNTLSPVDRPIIGMMVNSVRESIKDQLNEKSKEIEQGILKEQLAKETIDVTLPGNPAPIGSVHPLSKVTQELEDIFIGMGYSVEEGPEIERDYYNFEALNLPKDHPARDMQDTFYITEEILLRSHTSPVQIRTMERMKGQVPVKIICPGKVYRRDDDVTHSHLFTQIEGLVIDRHIRMSDLKGTLLQFVQKMFGTQTQIRLRPSYFPFTEPSAEVDISCMFCGQAGCRICKNSGWIEVLGSGMVHPNVLEMSGYDSTQYSGFAFGIGVERIAMLKYGVNDIRNFYTNDLRLLTQFNHI